MTGPVDDAGRAGQPHLAGDRPHTPMRRLLLAGMSALVLPGAAGRKLAVLALVDATGTGGFLAVSVVFLTRAVGLPAAVVGVGLSVSAAVGLVTTAPLGALADRFGTRQVLVGVCLWRAAGFTVYPLIADSGTFVLLVCLLGLVDKAAAPLQQALVGGTVLPAERVHTMAAMRSLRNVGFAVGAGLGALALAVDSRWAYAAILLANAASFLVAAILAARLPLLATAGAAVRRTFSLRALRDRPYLAIATLNGVLTLHTTLLAVGVPLWVAEHTDAPRSLIAVLLAFNTVLAVAFQVRVSRGVDATPVAIGRLRDAGFALACCCLLLALAPHLFRAGTVAILVLAVVALTYAELSQSAGGWAISYALAPADAQAAYLSVFWLGTGVQQIAAPAGLVIVMAAQSLGWVLLAAALAATGALVPAVLRWGAGAQHPRRPGRAPRRRVGRAADPGRPPASARATPSGRAAVHPPPVAQDAKWPTSSPHTKKRSTQCLQ